MPAISFRVKHFDENDLDSISIDYHVEENADLVYVANKENKWFFDFLNGEYFRILQKNRYSVQDEFKGSSKYKCSVPFINFTTQGITNHVTVFGEDIYDLVHQIEITIAANFIDWNEKFLMSINNVTDSVEFNNESERTLFLSELYKKNFHVKDYWYEKLQNEFGRTKLNILIRIKESLDQINFDLLNLPVIPSSKDVSYPSISFFDKIFGNEKILIAEYNRKISDLNARKVDLNHRKNNCERLNDIYRGKIAEFKNTVESYIGEVSRIINVDFRDLILKYEEGRNNVEFVKSTLKYSILNSFFAFEYNVDEIIDNSHVVCDVSLPNDNEVSKIKSYKEYKNDGRIEPIYYSERDFKKVYTTVIYSITFRLISEVFSSDYGNQIKHLTINGWVNALNKKNGQFENKCILSLSVNKSQFQDINFNNIDLVESFRHLKGVSAASLIDYIPIAPLISLNMNDKRFIQSEEILQKINESTNIAAINWEEFEHLIRELFEKEFAVNGGEVKVTQSSRDGGVDAIAFDPDPIRGGKIVIQSKRYTNVVGVSAIRDLYGTVLNEGATKGVIVTTSHYGNDAYEFANGKPLTLLDGNNLLSLLQKHGYKARIDLGEAKIMNNQEKGSK